jgi:hypothetical protein
VSRRPAGALARPPRPIYRDRMSERDDDSTDPDVMDMFDSEAGPEPVCRVCGSLVAATDVYRRAHWDWHEASNGA